MSLAVMDCIRRAVTLARSQKIKSPAVLRALLVKEGQPVDVVDDALAFWAKVERQAKAE